MKENLYANELNNLNKKEEMRNHTANRNIYLGNETGMVKQNHFNEGYNSNQYQMQYNNNRNYKNNMYDYLNNAEQDFKNQESNLINNNRLFVNKQTPKNLNANENVQINEMKNLEEIKKIRSYFNEIQSNNNHFFKKFDNINQIIRKSINN